MDERDRRQRIGDLGHVVAVALDLREQVDRLGVQRLVRLAGLVALADPLERPRLAARRARRLRVVDAVLRPAQCEAGVEDPARVERRRRAVDHRQRRDRGEAGRLRGGDEELADAAVAHPDHARLPLDPGLPRDGLDHVVAVEPLQRLEVVERAAAAAGPAHVDVDDRVAEQVGDLADRALPAVRVGVAVAGVLDQRGVRARAARQADVDRELRPVARAQVAVAAGGDPLRVALRARRRRPVREHADALARDAVAATRRHPAEHGAAERARALQGDPVAVPLEQQLLARLRPGHVHLLHAPAHDGARLRHRDGRAGEDEQDDDQAPIHGAALNRVSPALSIADSLAP